jgi:hypothetical protein
MLVSRSQILRRVVRPLRLARPHQRSVPLNRPPAAAALQCLHTQPGGEEEGAENAEPGEALRITYVGMVINLATAAIKGGAGVLTNSAALVSDAGHSLGDLVSDVVTLWAVQAARSPPDEDHPYGTVRHAFLDLALQAKPRTPPQGSANATDDVR